MSDVIKDAVIRIRYETQKSKLESPELSQTVRAHEEVAEATREVRSATEEAARAHEDFGRRSVASMAHAGHGVLQLTRGFALLGASGEESTQRVLENLIKIEAGVSIAKGGANLLKFAGEFGALGTAVGGLGVVVAAGVAIWDRFAESEKRALDAATKLQEKARAARDKLSATEDDIRRRAAAERTETETGANGSKARDNEAAALRSHRGELSRMQKDIEFQRARAERDRDANEEGRRQRELGTTTTDKLNNWLAARVGRVNGGETPIEQSTRLRDEAAATETRLRAKEAGLVDQQLADAEREKSILESKRSDNVDRIRDRESLQLQGVQDSLHPSDKWQEARVNMQVARFDAEQRRLAAQAEKTGLVPQGFEYGRSLEQSIASPIHQQATQDIDKSNRALTEAIKAHVDIIERFQLDAARLRSQLDAAHPN